MKARGIILDLDGTLYRGMEQVPGAADFVAHVRGAGARGLFVTNRANRPPREVRDQIRSYGIPCEEADVLTAGEATAMYLAPGKVYVVGEAALVAVLEAHGFRLTETSPDYVVVGLDRAFTYAKMKTATLLIRAGAKFVATNPDKGMSTEEGVVPGTGAVVAAIAAASGVEPLVVGKPQKLIVDMALARMGLRPDEVIMVGDNVETDVPAGYSAGVRTALILTGISTREDVKRAAIQPTWVADNFEALIAKIEREG